VKSSSGSGESVVRLIVRLLPPSQTRERPPKRVVAASTSKSGEAPSDVPLPDHLILPIRLTEIANMSAFPLNSQMMAH